MKTSSLLLLSILLSTLSIQAQDRSDYSFGKYDPSPENPFGLPNPEAPPEIAQFAFMIGEFATEEHIRNSDGSWRRSQATWNARYFLNGHGIMDYYWNEEEGFATTNIRIYNAKEKAWYVTFFRGPGNGVVSGQWIGRMEGENMVLWQGDKNQGSRLTFSNISQNGYDWIGESFKDGQGVPFWKEYATRIR